MEAAAQDRDGLWTMFHRERQDISQALWSQI